MATKQEEIKIRLTSEQKILIKKVAKDLNLTMSEFVLRHIEPIAKNKELELMHKDTICTRAEATDEKLLNIKQELENRKNEKKSKWFFK